MQSVQAARVPAAESRCVLCSGSNRRRLFMKRGWTFVRCAGCGLISVRPLPTAEALRAHVEQSYQDSTYAVYAAAEAIRAGIARHRMEIVAPMAPPGPWLEVGCATGALLAAARRAGFNAEGLDVSEFSVARARAEGLIVHHRAVEDFVPMQRYAVVAAFDVIEHLPDPIAFVERVGTWLEPGGLFVLTLPNAASALAVLMGRFWFQYWVPDHVHYFAPTTIGRLLAHGGFERVATRSARKALTLNYAVERLRVSNPRQARLLSVIMPVVPRRLRMRAWPVPVGEMLVTAWRRAAAPARDAPSGRRA